MPVRTLVWLICTASCVVILPGAAHPAAAQGDTVRVIVRLNRPFVPEGFLGRQQAANQRAAFDRAHRSLLARRIAGFIRGSKRLQTLPYAILEVERGAVSALRAQPEVAAIALDTLNRISLASTTAVVGSQATTAAGYTGQGAAVAILDTGTERQHPFLTGRIVDEACYSSTTSISSSLCPGSVESAIGMGSAEPCTGIGECDHGTHVAGIVAGRGGSFSGVAPDASIVSIQVYSRFDGETECGAGAAPCIQSWTSDIVLALERVMQVRTTHRIAAVNLSLGGGSYTSAAACDGDPTNAALKGAIENLRSVGIATIAAAGNEGQTAALSSPACLSSAVGVGSTTSGASPGVSYFTNYSSFLSFLAPGQIVFSSVTGAGYESKSGTSMASPHVAGAWAVLKAITPAASVNELLTILANTGTLVADVPTASRPGATGLSKPLIRVDRAAAALQQCSYGVTPASASFPASGGTRSVTISTGGGCSWGAVSPSTWVTFTSPASGRGAATVTFRVAANSSTTARSTVLTVAGQAVAVSQSGAAVVKPFPDLSGDGAVDLVWQNREQGWLAAWRMNGLSMVSSDLLSPNRVTDTAWRIAATADLNGDQILDLIWQHTTDGWVGAWLMNGLSLSQSVALTPERVADTDWRIVGSGDFNGDEKPDLVWHHVTQGWIAIWLMNGTTLVDSVLSAPGRVTDVGWQIVGAADFDSDGRSDLVWRHATEGWIVVWLMNGTTLRSSVSPSIERVIDPGWQIAGIGDVNRDGYPDLIWWHATEGYVGAWLMEGLTLIDSLWFAPNRVSDTNWRIVGPK